MYDQDRSDGDDDGLQSEVRHELRELSESLQPAKEVIFDKMF